MIDCEILEMPVNFYSVAQAEIELAIAKRAFDWIAENRRGRNDELARFGFYAAARDRIFAAQDLMRDARQREFYRRGRM